MAFRDGSAAWAAGRPTVIMPDGREEAFRLTLVFQKDGDEWKIVKWHFSTGVSNEELLGDSLTTG